MEYYVYRNGSGHHAIGFDSEEEARAYLQKLRAHNPGFWYMEDENSHSVEAV